MVPPLELLTQIGEFGEYPQGRRPYNTPISLDIEIFGATFTNKVHMIRLHVQFGDVTIQLTTEHPRTVVPPNIQALSVLDSDTVVPHR